MRNTTLIYIQKNDNYLMLHRTKKKNDQSHDKWLGIGGTFDKCAQLAKRALLRDIGERSPISHISALETELLEKINSLDIGAGGLGGACTAFAVNIETYPTHIAGLPVAVNICCHVNRHAVRILGEV